MEYKILQADTLINTEQLDRLALEGWILITIVPTVAEYFFYFRREL